MVLKAMTSVAEQRCIFDFRPDNEALLGLREVNPEQKQRGDSQTATDDYESRGSEEGSLVLEVSDRMVCSACSCSFSNREDQMEHYKLDWHRFNLKQKMVGMLPATAEEFEKKSGAGEMSSISGSGSDSEEDDLDREGGRTGIDAAGADNNNSDDTCVSTSRLSSKVFFMNSAGQYLSVFRCILQGKSDGDLGSSLKALNKATLWIILMTGGGHFAGAVFQGKEILQHKTFHRYTVRAKRGTAQGLRDSQNRSHAPKSAGAALRRHNEAALVKDIQDLLMSWSEHLKEASAIFIRAPSYNKTIFFGGRTAPLDKKDPRVSTLPFATRRPTFREVQRVHGVLSTVHIYGKDTGLSAVCSALKKPWKKTVNSQPEIAQEKEDPISSDEEEDVEIQLEVVELTLRTLDLKEFEVKPSRQKKRRRRKKEDDRQPSEDVAELSNKDTEIEHEAEVPQADEASPEKQSKNTGWKKEKSKKQAKETVDESCEYGLRDELFTACKVGDVYGLNRVLRLTGENPLCATGDTSDSRSPQTLLNEPIDFSGFTLLHVASAAAQRAVVRLLLDAGADPAIRDNKGQTPYIVAPDKDTRNVFRKYMGENPERYDYGRALVPGPLTAEIESKKMEKKKAQRALKKQREKTQKEEKKKEELEAEEKKRFASLSDREKRALAAERRLAEQVAAAGENLSNIKRCWQCGESLLGKTPFHYLDYSFCSPRCVQAHRKANAPAGKS